VKTGALDSFLASGWLPTGSKSGAESFADTQSKIQSLSAIRIVSKETISESNVILNVDFFLEEKHARERVVMKGLDGEWRFVGEGK